MKYFCLPSDFKKETIDQYSEINGRYEHSKIIETFGQLAPDSVFGSCRASVYLPVVDRNALEKYVKYSSEKGIEFNYVVNATCMANEELTGEGFRKIRDFLTMLGDMGVSWVTISLPSLMEIARYVAPDLKIKASTVCQINSPHKAKFYNDMGIKRIVLDEDINRRFDILRSIREVYSGDLEIIVNSFCVNDCPYKMFHYNSFSHSRQDREKYQYFGTRCTNMHLDAGNYLKLNWIRPEDLHFYTGTGINYFKLQGRTNVLDGQPAAAVTHYIEESYEGNLVSLLELFSESHPLSVTLTSIENRKLDGFVEKFFTHPDFCKKVCGNCGYCREFTEAAISYTDRTIMDFAKGIYKVTFGEYPGILEG